LGLYITELVLLATGDISWLDCIEFLKILFQWSAGRLHKYSKQIVYKERVVCKRYCKFRIKIMVM